MEGCSPILRYCQELIKAPKFKKIDYKSIYIFSFNNLKVIVIVHVVVA